MTMEQKLEIVRKALEMGNARIDINFHYETKKSATEKLNTLSQMFNVEPSEQSSEHTQWINLDEDDIEVTAFY